MKPLFARLLATSCASAFAATAFAQQAAPLPQAEDAYFAAARSVLETKLARQPNTNRARNVILFVGDGMGISTSTASRIFEGQSQGKDGVTFNLAWDEMPFAALSRTYSSDAQVTDSAPSATSMTTGVKTRNDTLGLDQSVEYGVCGTGKVLKTIAEMAEEAGYATGVVTTTRITHATPAAMYAHTPNRDWESDADVPAEAQGKCQDIATQLIDWPAGDGFEVILGGGRAQFMPKTEADPEYPEKKGKRADGRDLIGEWQKRHHNQAASYVWNLDGFDKVDPAKTDDLLGLFEPSHMQYDADRSDEPSLADMTAKAIDILSKNDKGYVLMVEGGRIDHAHHEGNAYRALTDTVALDKAVHAALAKVNLDDTLVVVTADHSHVFSIAGYPERSNPILGLVRGVDGKVEKAEDGRPYTTLGYLNGPGSIVPVAGDIEPQPAAAAAAAPSAPVLPLAREDLSDVDTTAKDFKQQAVVPLTSETHSGEDVAIYADGPFAQLFTGVVGEQYTFHVMRHALGWDAQ